ncbi:cytochrome P450 [Deinococcus yavapaiensis]|uniref:Cytochrome P450 n=1 Tax=Deinococcus yavapaiensis KR-236 TaxID=694435 RepID=A0A318S868_9DEIO|nr:cytochrome P450 [Deinococcus yavapaiensis]PYE53928.1 cytochrome P450 [Deinococcus yavapaiensis KR-236]
MTRSPAVPASLPTPLPFVGHTPAFARDPLSFLDRLAATERRVVFFDLGGSTALLTRPEDVHFTLQETGRLFSKGYQRGFAMPLVFGSGLVTSEGDFWRRQRKLIQPAFHAVHVASYAETMVTLTCELLGTWRSGETRDVNADMTLLTQRIVVATMFGASLHEDERRLADALGTIERGIILDSFSWRAVVPPHLPAPGRRALSRAVEHVEEVLAWIVARRRALSEERADLLGLLMAARDEDGQPMSDAQLRDEIMTLYIAGHETTAHTLSWALWLLGRHPQELGALREELDGVLGDRAPTFADLPKLPRLDAVVKETLRLYPPAWIFNRQLDADVTFGEDAVAKGTQIMISPWVLHRSDATFDAPLDFRPARWHDGLERRLPKGAYIPFGGGPRICIGNAFATMEAALVLALIVRAWNVEVPRVAVPTPSITLHPKGGLPSRVSRR